MTSVLSDPNLTNSRNTQLISYLVSHTLTVNLQCNAPRDRTLMYRGEKSRWPCLVLVRRCTMYTQLQWMTMTDRKLYYTLSSSVIFNDHEWPWKHLSCAGLFKIKTNSSVHSLQRAYNEEWMNDNVTYNTLTLIIHPDPFNNFRQVIGL